MKIITCYKSVHDEQDITVNHTDGTLDFSRADSKISQYDLNAIEAAVQLKQLVAEAHIVALSVGGNILNNVKGRKDVLSRGPDELAVVIDDQLENALPHQTAAALAAAANKQGFDLILCGDGSADLYAQQVGLLLGEVLCVTTDINTPQIPSMKAILSAAKKPVQVWTAADVGIGEVTALSEQHIAAPKQKQRLRIIIDGDGEEQIAALAGHLRKIIQ